MIHTDYHHNPSNPHSHSLCLAPVSWMGIDHQTFDIHRLTIIEFSWVTSWANWWIPRLCVAVNNVISCDIWCQVSNEKCFLCDQCSRPGKNEGLGPAYTKSSFWYSFIWINLWMLWWFPLFWQGIFQMPPKTIFRRFVFKFPILNGWLVVWKIFSIQLGRIIPTDFHIFQRDRAQPPTRLEISQGQCKHSPPAISPGVMILPFAFGFSSETFESTSTSLPSGKLT